MTQTGIEVGDNNTDWHSGEDNDTEVGDNDTY